MVALGKRGRGVNPYVVVEIFLNALSSWLDVFHVLLSLMVEIIVRVVKVRVRVE
jgi:hypothetical protein